MKAFALVDCNNFFCSCEQVFDPKLQHKPVVVLSNNDGCIISRCERTKALGIPMGAPLFKYKDVLEAHEVRIFSSNFQLYGDMSRRVMSTLSNFSENIEVYSIDEAFLKFEDFGFIDLVQHISNLKEIVKRWTGIPVSIGIGETKTLAKIANHLAKKNGGIFDIRGNREILKTFKVEDIWGVGRKWSERLKRNGIFTAHELLQADKAWIRKQFSVIGERMLLELKGISCLEIEDVKPKKSIVSSRSFSRVIKKKEELEESVSYHAAKIAEKLRRQGSIAQMVCVYIRTNKYRQSSEQYYNSEVYTLSIPSANTVNIIKAAKECLNKIYKSGFLYNKAGVMVTNIIPEESIQLDLFAEQESEKSKRLMAAIDKINKKGNNVVFIASQGIKREWMSRSERRSRRYTTSWDELLTAC